MKRVTGWMLVGLLLGTGTSSAGLNGFMSAKVSGTVQQSVPLDPSGQKIVTSKLSNQSIFEMFEYLGRDETLARLRAGRARLG